MCAKAEIMYMPSCGRQGLDFQPGILIYCSESTQKSNNLRMICVDYADYSTHKGTGPIDSPGTFLTYAHPIYRLFAPNAFSATAAFTSALNAAAFTFSPS